MKYSMLGTGLMFCTALLTGPEPHAEADSTVGASFAADRIITWSPEAQLPAGVDHHATFVTEGPGGRYLHVAGGTDYATYFAEHWRARIREDGGLKGWTAAEDLPSGRAGPGVAVVGRTIVLAGGQLPGRRNTAEVLVARVGEDGTSGPWREGPPLPAPAFHNATVAAGDHVYVTGGLGAEGAETGVYGARVGEDGRLERWRTLTSMPGPRSHHAAFVHDDGLYVVGGRATTQDEPLGDVLRAPIRPDGTLGAWTRLAAMDSAYGTHSAAVHGGYAYVLGGVENNVRWVDRVQRAPLRDGGGLGPWEAVADPLPEPRGHVHQTPVVGDRIYSAGGSLRREVTADVYVGRLNPGGG